MGKRPWYWYVWGCSLPFVYDLVVFHECVLFVVKSLSYTLKICAFFCMYILIKRKEQKT